MDPIISLQRAGLTRKELRRMVGTRMGDLLVLTATDASGSATTFIDTVHLTADVNYYAGRYAYFCGGQPLLIGTTAYVRTSSRDTSSLTFSQGLPGSVLPGDEVHLVNWSGVGFTPDDYHQSMNDSIRDSNTHDLIPGTITVQTSYDDVAREITIPQEVKYIQNVWFNDPYDGWRPARKARDGSFDGWYVNRATSTISLGNTAAYNGQYVRDNPLRVDVLVSQTTMETDADQCALEPSWFVEDVCARMLEKNITLNPGLPNRDRIYQQLRTHADNIRPLISVRQSEYSERINR